MEDKKKPVIDYSTQSPLNASRFKWNFAARKAYEGERRVLDTKRRWSSYDNLSFEDKDYYRARAQQLVQNSRGYNAT